MRPIHSRRERQATVLNGRGSRRSHTRLAEALRSPQAEDIAKALDYYRALATGSLPRFVPRVIHLPLPVHGDPPFHLTMAPAGLHACRSYRFGAISVMASNGDHLGVKPDEFEVVEWMEVDADRFSDEQDEVWR